MGLRVRGRRIANKIVALKLLFLRYNWECVVKFIIFALSLLILTACADNGPSVHSSDSTPELSVDEVRLSLAVTSSLKQMSSTLQWSSSQTLNRTPSARAF